MINSLVVNGCSYMNMYANVGNGHRDLAKRLGIEKCSSIALPGSSNSRILRTTLKHSFAVNEPTMYVLGMSFLDRDEIPILKDPLPFEGKWVNPQNQPGFVSENHWSKKNNETYVDLLALIRWYSRSARAEDLMYRILSTIESLESRGHGVLIFQYADSAFDDLSVTDELQLFSSKKNIISAYQWVALRYQIEHNVPQLDAPKVPENFQKPVPGSHSILNEFLANYIIENRLLDVQM